MPMVAKWYKIAQTSRRNPKTNTMLTIKKTTLVKVSSLPPFTPSMLQLSSSSESRLVKSIARAVAKVTNLR